MLTQTVSHSTHASSGRPSRRKPPLRMIRPSLLDLRFTGDPWIETAREGTFTICLGDYRLAGLSGLTIDLPSLNQVLDQLRHRQRKVQRAVLLQNSLAS